MKKVISGITAAVLTLLGLVALSFASIVPASASIDDTNVTICHYDEGQGGKYGQIRVSEHSIVKKTDAFLGHGKHEKDIIPPFDWNFGGSDYGVYLGQNWTPENEALWKHGNLEMTGCAPFGNELTPNVPLSPKATCVNPFPQLAETAQPAGVTYTSELDKKKAEYTVTFAKPADTPYQNYWFAEDVVNPVKVAIIPAGPEDEFWDETKGECHLPDTGASGFSTGALIGAGGFIFAGLIAFSITNLIGRRRNA
jgi:hypothetical protein